MESQTPDLKLNPLAESFQSSPLTPPAERDQPLAEADVDGDQAEQFVKGLDLVHNLESHAAWLASMISTLPKTLAGKGEEGESCSRCKLHVATQRAWDDEVQSIRDGWNYEKWSHAQTCTRLHELHAVVNACDAAYRAISFSHDGMFATGIHLSQIAQETIAAHWDTERERKCQDAVELAECKTRKLKQRSKGLIKANRAFCEFAGKLESELQKYESWLEERSSGLQKNYAKYCEIMIERGAEPSLLYGDADSIDRARQAYVEAWDERQRAARQAVETAYLDGVPDMLEGICET